MPLEVQRSPIEKLIFYARNPRNNDTAGQTAVLERYGLTFDQIAGERSREVWDAAA